METLKSKQPEKENSKKRPFFLKRKYLRFRDKHSLTGKKGLQKLKNFQSGDIDGIWDFLSNNFYGQIMPQQVEAEFKELLNFFVERAPNVIMEIGTMQGGTLFCFSKLAADDALIISIDLPKAKYGGGYPKWKVPVYQSFKKTDQTMFLLREDSHQDSTLEKLKNILNGRLIDFLLIDGDHSYEGVKKDFEMYSPLVRKGGIIALHDIAVHPPEANCNVSEFWAQITPPFLKELIQDKKQGWGGIGVLEK